MVADILGQTFSRLTVVGRETSDGARHKWRCVCSCGNQTVVRSDHLRQGHTRSCGCIKARSGGERNDPLHAVWQAMKARCLNPTDPSYPNYGGRGIKICERWLASFEAFCADMGPRPSRDHSIERDENEGDYEPANCRWATRAEQSNNRRTNRLLSVRDRTMTMREWEKENGLKEHTIKGRLKRGWTVEDAVMTPTRGWVARKKEPRRNARQGPA